MMLDAYALQFLRKLAQANDISDVAFSFRCYQDFVLSDGSEAPIRGNRCHHGTFKATKSRLKYINDGGAAIGIVINQMDGIRQTASNITALRGAWCDLDALDKATGGLKNGLVAYDPAVSRLPLEPTMVVRTPNGWHLYWLYREPVPIIEPIVDPQNDPRLLSHKRLLQGIQKALSQYGADPAVCSPAQILRLPGFYHWKSGKPKMVELIATDGPYYTPDDIREAFGVADIDNNVSSQCPVSDRHTCADNGLDGIMADDCQGIFDAMPAGKQLATERYLAKCPPAIDRQRGSYALLSTANKLIARVGLDRKQAAAALWLHYNPRCLPPWQFYEVIHKVSSAWGKAPSQAMGA